MQRPLSMFGDPLFYASTHALSESLLDPLNWTIKASTRLITATVGYVTMQGFNMMVW